MNEIDGYGGDVEDFFEQCEKFEYILAIAV
jgi:hypothetical protein